MAGDSLQSLRTLAKKFHIRYRREEEEWPETHKKTFQNIKTLGEYRYNTYSQGVSVLSEDEPWKLQTKIRAKWLVKRAERLFGQQRNEAGWRFGLENDVLRRFTVEVACPKCRARVWQSEIQATWKNENDDYARLEERRRQRRPCQCPPDERPKDFYEIGTNAIFDDRVDEFVIYDDEVSSQLPKQGPDRVFGLQTTRNFDSLLSSPVKADIRNRSEDTIADILRITPFKAQSDPLLFPFLVLEAKSETSPRGFEAILVQSSFPIRALLKMQDDLRSHVFEGEKVFDPLVWFLASRGNAWKVWCGHVTKGTNGDPTKYETTLLWSGSLLHRDDALQLVLIVDYIMDWARDIYRTAILRQLKSMVTGQPYDQISLADSNMLSMRRNVANWIPAPPSTVNEFMQLDAAVIDGDNVPPVSRQQQALLDIAVPDTRLGSLRSASRTDSQFSCLYLTKTLLPSFLQVIAGRNNNKSSVEKAARQIVNLVTQFDDILVLSKADLDLIEILWTGEVREASPNDQAEDFYVIIEASWYFGPAWEITREISCVAVTKSAFKILEKYANFRVQHKGIDSLPSCERRCPSSAIRQCIDCLQSGSPWQNLLSAISCALATIYPLPTRRREDFTPPVDVLGLGYTHYSRVKSFTNIFLKKNLWKPRKIPNGLTREMAEYMSQGHTREEYIQTIRQRPPRHTDTSWKRVSHQRNFTHEDDLHIHDRCSRCSRSPESNISPFAHGYLDTRNVPVPSDRNAVLIFSIQPTDVHRNYQTDSCLFALEKVQEIDQAGLSIIIENFLKLGRIYHTFRYKVNDTILGSDFGYNLPLPYRSVARNEKLYLERWIRELREEPQVDDDPRGRFSRRQELDYTRKIMYMLSVGHSEKEAKYLANTSARGYHTLLERMVEGGNRGDTLLSFKKVKLSGDPPAEPFSSWDDGKQYLRRKYPEQISYMETISKKISTTTSTA